MVGSGSSSIHALLGGRQRGVRAALLRGGLRCAEPFYASAMRLRNLLYDNGTLSSRRLPARVVSVGNITAGGTGKTPVVQWLASAMRQAGMHPAVLLRGYRKGTDEISDEQELLAESLAPIVVHANPDRVAGAVAVMREHPGVDLFILDDAFQHRRVERDIDLVLVDATNPFGYGHVLPRGLLREPVAGLGRADAVIITRSDLVSRHECTEIEQTIRAMNRTAPIYRARHQITGLRSREISAADPPDIPLESLAQHRFFAFAGIANPRALHRQLSHLSGQYAGHHWFTDHHAYSQEDIAEMRHLARSAGAQVLLVTEKDWRKLRRLPEAHEDNPPIRRLGLQIAFEHQLDQGLIQFIEAELEQRAQAKR